MQPFEPHSSERPSCYRRRPHRQSPPWKALAGTLILALLISASFAAALFLGCATPPQPLGEPLLHLARALPLADIEREAAEIDLGTPQARPHLGTGWSHDEQDPDGRTFVWSTGPVSDLTFHLVARRPVLATFEGKPFTFAGAPEQEVTVTVNGTPVGTLAMDGVGPVTLELPPEAVRAGANRLRLVYRYHRQPREVYPEDSADARSLAMAWYRIAFGGADPRGEVRTAQDTLYLPWGTRVDYHVRLPAGSSLHWNALRPRGTTPGEIRVSLTPEAGSPLELGRFTAPAGETLLRLPVDAGPARAAVTGPTEDTVPGQRQQVLRLSLQAIGRGEVPPGSGILIEAPMLRAPSSPRKQPRGEAPRAHATAGAEPGTENPPSPPLNLLIYMVDTLRADRLGCYGYRRETSPSLDDFAREAVLFEQAVAQSPWTRPSVASFFTGVWPGTHGVHGRRDTLAPEAVTLAEVLRDAGWQTAGFITNGNVARAFGFAQGFEDFRLLSRTEVSSEAIHHQAAKWLAERHRAESAGSGEGRPFFLYLHTVDPHSPYAPEPEFRRRFAPQVPEGPIGMRWWLKRLKGGEIVATPQRVRYLSDLYDAEVAQNDRAFGRLLNLLAEHGLEENTVVVLLSDHGEEFHEHGNWEHGKSLHTEVLDVPLVIRFPGGPSGRRIPTPVQHIDLPPTLLSWLGVAGPTGIEGRDLTPLLRDSSGTVADLEGSGEIFSHLALDDYRAASVTTGRWRLIEGRSRAHGLGTSLYDRSRDRWEHRDVSAERPVTAGYLGALLRARELAKEGSLRAGEAQLDAELEAQLRALGYLP